MEMQSIWWLVLLIVFVLIEVATMGLTTIWFAGGAIGGFIVSLAGGNLVIQIIVFLAVSVLLLLFTRPFAVRYINQHHVKTNVEGLIGKQAVVTQEISNIQETGEAKLEGKEWMARSEDETLTIPAGRVVTVVRVSGVKLMVKETVEN